jgi:3-oxoacyl-[acyl-carrier protein] reductase
MQQRRKTALVTGSARGIGRAIALDLAGRGNDIVINFITRADAAEQVAKEIRSIGPKALAVRADVAQEKEVKTMVHFVTQELGPISILVNNAALHRGGKIHKIDSQNWKLVVDSVLKGAFHCCKYIVPQMIEEGWGRIINISSNTGLHGYPGDTAYGSAKAGIIGFTKSLAKEVANKGITANVIVPGYFKTDMTSVLFDTGEKIENLLNRIPMRRPGELEEIAEVATFLASSASYITGAVIRVDGGLGM